MKVVSDTSPILYLILIDEAALLGQLFQRIFIPPAVKAELLHPATPARVRREILQRPAWLDEVAHFAPSATVSLLSDLDPGERDAILLAESISADLLILDERKARRAALDRGHRVAGLLALLAQGAVRGLVDFDKALERLAATTFRLDPSLVDLVRARFS
ncbi:MAG TPA: DUF3368 domain-containing protein [Thermoanaerobaculia bacterium]|nr:DUF3368 domain-containing protein [Thermoanaerobaculia bacterium]